MHTTRLLFLLLASYCLMGCNGQIRTSKPDTANKPLYYPRRDDLNISLVKLLAYPERYDKQTVQVIGYLNLEFEANALYFHKEDYEAAISKNGIWINISRDSARQVMRYNNKYVIMGGVFDAKHDGHMGMFSGSLTNITKLELWYQPKKKR